MSFRTIPTYHSAPNFSIPPPDANGPIQLGTLLRNLGNPTPLNAANRIPIPNEDIFTSHLDGFQTTMRRQTGAKLGIFAKLLGQYGVDGSVNGSQSKEEILSVARVDTEFFNPSPEYIRLAIEVPCVRTYRAVFRDTLSLYLVTGIKVARGASMSVMRGRAFGGGVEVGMPDPATGLVQIGATAGGEMSRENGMGFQHSSDFVLGYRVSLVTKKKDEVKLQAYTRGATMLTDDVEEVVNEHGGELEVIHDFGADAVDVFVDDDACRWVLAPCVAAA